MIVRILSSGTSFKGVAAYLTHDPDAKTSERVGWTHTLNLANDHVPSAVDEMLWTSRDAELLKQEAGIRAGGRATEKTVKHLSLNWAPDETPTREHMIGTTEDFLRHMGWHEHQAILVSHEDKAFSHVHVVLNVIHPETGLRLDDNFERRRAQTWALAYEREQGRIYCEQRLNDIGEREEGPTRPAWMGFKEKEKDFEREENARREAAAASAEKSRHAENPETDNDGVWKILKDFQRGEREGFFAEGKSAFSDLRQSVYREVREEFRDRWAEYYAAKREGADPEELAALKAGLLADQQAVLGSRRDEACAGLRESRNGLYRDLLDQQRELREELRERQEAGEDNALFLQMLEDRKTERESAPSFHEGATEVTGRSGRNEGGPARFTSSDEAVASEAGTPAGADIGGIGSGIGRALFTVGNSLFLELMGEQPAPRAQEPPGSPGSNPFQAAAEEAQKRQQREQETADEDWRRRQKDLARD